MYYAVDLREHDDINGICIGKTYRLFSFTTNDDGDSKIVKDYSEKTYYTRGCDEDDVNKTFDVDMKRFDSFEDASNYFNLQGGYEDVYNPVWDVIDNVFRPKNYGK